MATSIQLRKINRNNIYRNLLEEQNTSKQKISRKLGLSIPTVTQGLNDLEKMGLIYYNGVFNSTGGRKAQVVSAVSDAKISIGVDITANHINLVIIDLSGKVLNSERIRITFQNSEEYYKNLNGIINDAIGDRKEKILGVNISIPGIIDEITQEVRYAPLLKQPRDLIHQLKKYISYSIHLVNDATAGAYSELYGERKKDNFLYLMLSNSVGGAAIIDGKIIEGKSFRSGEFGHITIVPYGRKCYCGQLGCVDAYCSASLLSSLADDNLELFFQSLKRGDEKCVKAWGEYLEYLCIIVNNLQVGFDCEIILGGYVGWYLKPYLDEIRNRVKARCPFPAESVTISVGKYNLEASALGAAMYYINQFVENV